MKPSINHSPVPIWYSFIHPFDITATTLGSARISAELLHSSEIQQNMNLAKLVNSSNSKNEQNNSENRKMDAKKKFDDNEQELR